MNVTILALLFLVVFVSAEEATCRADAYPSRLDQALEQLIIRTAQRCMTDLGERYGGLPISMEEYERTIDRNCCPVPENPCPCSVSDLRFGFIRLDECLYN